MNRFLVVDDEPHIRSLLAETLHTVGDAEVDSAADGQTAFERAEKNDYNLVLLDLKMPGMDGLEVLRRLRAIRPEVPVIMLTAYGTTEAAVDAMKLGATDFIEKPFDPHALKAMVRRLLDSRRTHRQEKRDYSTHFHQAKQCVEDGHLDAAVEHLRLAIALEPDRPEAFNMLGAIHEMQDDIQEANKHYRVAWHLDPTYAPASANLKRVTSLPHRSTEIQFGDLRHES